VLRALSSQPTKVDDKPVANGEEVPVREGTVVQLAHVMTLRFHGAERTQSVRDAVTMQQEDRGTGFHRTSPTTPAPSRDVERERCRPTLPDPEQNTPAT
jgi:hypothetical protein